MAAASVTRSEATTTESFMVVVMRRRELVGQVVDGRERLMEKVEMSVDMGPPGGVEVRRLYTKVSEPSCHAHGCDPTSPPRYTVYNAPKIANQACTTSTKQIQTNPREIRRRKVRHPAQARSALQRPR
ncbi:hypothetical protein DPSP01_004159 [Paraphaeosphaeria sporulosa]